MKIFASRGSQSIATLKVQYLTERQVAECTGLSVYTLRAHRFKRHGIAYSKIGRAVRYKLEDVIAYFDAHRIPHTD